jgi:AAA15 family ATPase/GTPase
MKIKIRNLGPIRDEAQFELKPLTIFIGPNNSGKTWLAYTLAALFGKFGIVKFTDEDRTTSILNAYPPLAKVIDDLLKTGIASMDIYQFADIYGEQYFNEIISCVRENFAQFMGTQIVSFDALQMSIELNGVRSLFLKRIQDTSFHASIGLGKQKNGNTYGEQNALFRIRKQKGRKNISMYFVFEDQSEEEIPREILREIIEERIIWYIFRTIHCALFFDVVVLPTERITFLTLPFSTQPLEQRVSDQEINQDIRPLSLPVSDYVSSVISVAAIGPTKMVERKQEAQKNSQVQTYIDLSYFLEQQILNGKVEFSTPEPISGREILFHPNDCTSPLEISLASSMVKELAPLVFHLRYFAQPNELLIIDEPEMNLHPTAQVQMLEFLAILVDAGVNVLVTTHSPYIIDHLGNLTKASQHPDKERIQSEFYLKDYRAFIDENNISMYFVDRGTVQDALHNEELDWNTFAHVSDRLSEIYFLL